MFNIKIKKLNKDAQLDNPAKSADAGYDIHSYKDISLEAEIGPYLIPTGLSIEFPEGYMCRVENRSGIALKKGLLYVNGIIDAGYRGEIGLICYNFSGNKIEIKKGEKLAQLCFYKIKTAPIEEVQELSITDRGQGGFGSTN